MAPTVRVTARVLPVSRDGAVLLLEERDPARPDRRYWSSIGGAVDPGESLRDAAAREMYEETGIVVPPGDLVGPVSVVENAYSWGGVDRLGQHTCFALPLEQDVEVSFEHLETEEVGNVLGSRWWSIDDVDGVEYEPPMLGDIMRAAIAAVEESR